VVSRLRQNFREIAKKATQYPAIVVDTHGKRASARLSNNGAVIHNLQVVGGNVKVGESISVDYTTPEPTIVALSKSWATMDDLNRLLAKYQIPIPDIKETEYDKVMLFSMDDASDYRTFPPTTGGIASAVGYAYTRDEEELGDNQGFRHWAIRLPPFEVVPTNWGSDIGFYRPIHVFSEGTTGARLHGYMYAHGGSTFENIHFYWNAEQEKGQYPTYNLFLVLTGNDDPDFTMNDGDLTPPEEVYDTRFTRCNFTCFGYDFVPAETPPPSSIPDYPSYVNVNLSVGEGDNITKVFFDNCDFYAQSAGNVDWLSGRAVENDWSWFTGDAQADLFFTNCRVLCGPEPLAVNVGSGVGTHVRKILTSNTRWKNVPDIPNMDYMEGQTMGSATMYLGYESDLSPIDHVHTSGSSGGYDEHAIHLDESGEF
jgi:hypothetical protein